MDIKSKRLWVRDFERSDWEAVHTYTSDAHVMKYMPEGVLSEEETKSFVLKNVEEHAEKFPVIRIEDDMLIGHIVFHKYFGEHTYEIGWVFNPDYQQKGYATEAAGAVLEYAFNHLNLHRVVATCQPENTSSYRVMEKIGMRREGFFKQCIPHGADWWDEYCYAILEKEFKENAKNL